MSEYHVSFPGLGWSFRLNSTAFSIGSFEVKWYGIIIGLGFLLAFVYGMTSCKKMKLHQGKLLDAVIIGLIGGIIGARVYYVLFFDGDKYLKDPISIFYIHEGGLGIYGGIIGGLVAGGITAKVKKINALAALDIACLGFLIGQAVGRWGNFVNQEAFGSQTSLPWGMVSENTGGVPVHPCFFYEFLWCGLGFVLLHIFTRKFRRYDGQTFLCYVMWYGTGRFFIEALRTDSLIIWNMKVSQLLAAVTVLVAAALLIIFRKRTKLSGCGAASVMELNHITYDDSTDEGLNAWQRFWKGFKDPEKGKKERRGKADEEQNGAVEKEPVSNEEDKGGK